MSLDFSNVNIVQVQKAISELGREFKHTDIKVLEAIYGKQSFDYNVLKKDHDTLNLSICQGYVYTLDPIIYNAVYQFNNPLLSLSAKCLAVIFYHDKIAHLSRSQPCPKEFLEEVEKLNSVMVLTKMALARFL